MLIKGKLECTRITPVNVYTPPNSDWNFYRMVFDIMESVAEGVTICGGDLNVKLNDKIQ